MSLRPLNPVSGNHPGIIDTQKRMHPERAATRRVRRRPPASSCRSQRFPVAVALRVTIPRFRKRRERAKSWVRTIDSHMPPPAPEKMLAETNLVMPSNAYCNQRKRGSKVRWGGQSNRTKTKHYSDNGTSMKWCCSSSSMPNLKNWFDSAQGLRIGLSQRSKITLPLRWLLALMNNLARALAFDGRPLGRRLSQSGDV